MRCECGASVVGTERALYEHCHGCASGDPFEDESERQTVRDVLQFLDSQGLDDEFGQIMAPHLLF